MPGGGDGSVLYAGARCIASVQSKKSSSEFLKVLEIGNFFHKKNVFLLKRKVTSPVCIRNLPLTSVKTALGSIFCCVEKFWRHFHWRE